MNKRHLDSLSEALQRLETDEAGAGAWTALPALARLQSGEWDFDLDLAASRTLGAPVVFVRERVAGAEGLECLTPRQREVAGLIAKGLSNRKIAVELGITLATTKDHVHAVLDRLGCASRAAVAARLYGEFNSRSGN
ncbi:response regulator transcription factor [Oricola sp.]|uniref:response regulator transcription factor n=1 Tax=Oricola sp. TaxID=1979950 RepID=UPI003BAC5912